MTERIPHADMADRLAALVWSKDTWLREHGPKRPVFEVEQRRRELECLQQAAADYRRASQREVKHA